MASAAGLVLLGLGFGREIPLNHLILDGVVAFEDQLGIADAAKHGDLAQTVQPSLLLEAG